jgi:hypothetical protein
MHRERGQQDRRVPMSQQIHLVGKNSKLDLEQIPTLAEFNRAALKVAKADVHYCLLEFPVSQSLELLPPSLHPGIPAIFASLHYHCGDSEIGPFDLLTTAIFCRSAAKHRMMTLSAFTDSAKAQTFFRDGWGYAPQIADIRLAINYDRVRSIVSRAGRTLLDVGTHDPTPLTGPGAAVRYAQSLNLARTPHGVKFVQVDVSFDFKNSARGVPALATFEGAQLGFPFAAPVDPVSGTLVHADVAFSPIRFLADAAVAAESGGIIVIPDPNAVTA